MPRTLLSCVLLSLSLASPAFGQHREHKAHVHGHAALNVAIEGKRVEMELEAPGADIVGFEHRAESAGDKAAVQSAKARLANASKLFRFTEAAGCALEMAKVELEVEKDDGHGEFHAYYVFACAAPERIEDLSFPFFDAFPRSEELEVQLITSRGSHAYEVERDTPRIELGAIH